MMDHADVHAWLDDTFFEPGHDKGRSAALSDHLAECSECAAYEGEMRRTALALGLARGPSPETRARVLGVVRSAGRPRGRSTRVAGGRSGQPAARGAGGSWRMPQLHLATAVLAIGVIGALVGAMLSMTIRPAAPDSAQLARAVAIMTELAAESAVHEMVLQDQAGAKAGMALVSMESHRMAVFSSALARPAQGEYGCWVERGDQREWLGPVHFADGLAFWAGPMDGIGDYGTRPGDMLVVAAGEDSPAMLSANF